MVSFGNLPNRVSKLTGILFRGAKVAERVTLMQEVAATSFGQPILRRFQFSQGQVSSVRNEREAKASGFHYSDNSAFRKSRSSGLLASCPNGLFKPKSVNGPR